MPWPSYEADRHLYYGEITKDLRSWYEWVLYRWRVRSQKRAIFKRELKQILDLELSDDNWNQLYNQLVEKHVGKYLAEEHLDDIAFEFINQHNEVT